MVKSSCDTGNLNKPCLLRWKCLTTSRFSRRLIIILNLTQMEWLVSWVRLGVLDMRIKTKITASHTLNEKRNKQTKRKKNNNNNTHHKNYMEIRELIEIILRAVCPNFFEDSRLHCPKGSCIFSVFTHTCTIMYI